MVDKLEIIPYVGLRDVVYTIFDFATSPWCLKKETQGDQKSAVCVNKNWNRLFYRRVYFYHGELFKTVPYNIILDLGSYDGYFCWSDEYCKKIQERLETISGLFQPSHMCIDNSGLFVWGSSFYRGRIQSLRMLDCDLTHWNNCSFKCNFESFFGRFKKRNDGSTFIGFLENGTLWMVGSGTVGPKGKLSYSDLCSIYFSPDLTDPHRDKSLPIDVLRQTKELGPVRVLKSKGVYVVVDNNGYSMHLALDNFHSNDPNLRVHWIAWPEIQNYIDFTQNFPDYDHFKISHFTIDIKYPYMEFLDMQIFNTIDNE